MTDEKLRWIDWLMATVVFSTVLVVFLQVVIVVYRLVADGEIYFAIFTLALAAATINAVLSPAGHETSDASSPR